LLPYTEDSEGFTNEFLRKFVEMLLEYMKTTFDRSSKILDFHHPEQLLEILDLTLPNEPQNIDQLLADCRDTLKYQVKTGQSFLSSLYIFYLDRFNILIYECILNVAPIRLNVELVCQYQPLINKQLNSHDANSSRADAVRVMERHPQSSGTDPI